MQEAPKRQFTLRTLLLLTTVIAAVLGSCIGWCRSQRSQYQAYLARMTGPVISRDDWPLPLKEVLEVPEGVELDESAIQVYCLNRGFDPEFVWRMDATPGLLEHLKQQWRLTQVAGPGSVMIQRKSRFSGIATPVWWSPKDDGDTMFFVNPNELEREKSDRLQVAYDAKQQAIFVWYWFNF